MAPIPPDALTAPAKPGRPSTSRAALLRAAIALLTAVSALVPAAPLAAADREEALVVGDRAPELQLGDQHGKPFRLSDALGAHRFVVLAFYPKAFTGG